MLHVKIPAMLINQLSLVLLGLPFAHAAHLVLSVTEKNSYLATESWQPSSDAFLDNLGVGRYPHICGESYNTHTQRRKRDPNHFTVTT